MEGPAAVQLGPARGRQGAGFITEPLGGDVVIAGPASLDVHLKSWPPTPTYRDAQCGAAGWPRDLRAERLAARFSPRVEPDRSTALNPFPMHLARHAAPLARARYSLVRVPILPIAHAFRAGSRIRVTIQAPGGDRPRWSFATVDGGRTRNTVALGGSKASSLVLPILTGATADGTPLPAPTALRGQPSRIYMSASNGG